MSEPLIDLAGLSVDAEAFLGAVLKTTAQPIWVVDPDGVIRFANPAALDALGYESASELFLAHQAMLVHVLRLDRDSLSVNGANILAFEAGIEWDITRVKGGTAGMLAGGLFNVHLQGTGLVALVSDGEPLRLDVAEAPTFADPQAAIAWSGGVSTSLKTDMQAKSLIGMGSGESFQLGFSGQGWVLVQPSEGRPLTSA